MPRRTSTASGAAVDTDAVSVALSLLTTRRYGRSSETTGHRWYAPSGLALTGDLRIAPLALGRIRGRALRAKILDLASPLPGTVR